MFWFRQASRNGHDCTSIYPFHRQWTHECLNVRCETEWNVIGVVKELSRRVEIRCEFVSPDVPSRARDGDFVGEAVAHGHDICDERDRRILVRKLTPEKPKVLETRVRVLEILEGDGVGYP